VKLNIKREVILIYVRAGRLDLIEECSVFGFVTFPEWNISLYRDVLLLQTIQKLL
jgi:hypothetical protein